MALVTEISDLLSGGLFGQALERLANSSQAIYNIPAPELAKLIPQLTLQVQQGTMDPATAAAAFVNMQGSMKPAEVQAALAQLQNFMTPAQMATVSAVVRGEMKPAQAQAALQTDSEMRGVTGDQASVDTQRRMIAGLEDIAVNQGLTQADRARFSALMNQMAAEEAQNRAAQIQQLEMRGLGGSGAELAARLAGAQSGSNARAAAGAELAQSAQARALQALQAGTAASSNLNTQTFDQAARRAAAQDVVNQFNTQARNTVNLQNAQMEQAANLAGFQAGQQVELANLAAAQAAAQQNAANQQAAGLTNTQLAAQFALANQQAQQQAAMQTAANQQSANQLNFQTANQMALANQQNQQAANMANAGFQQQANQANFNMANTIGATNVGIQNQQAMLPFNAAQADFTNRMNQAVAGSTADYRTGSTLANLAGQQAANTSGLLGTLANSQLGKDAGNWVYDAAKGAWNWVTKEGGGLDQAGDFIGGIVDWISDEDLKTDRRELSDQDVDRMMAQLTGYKYRYRGSQTNPEQVGIMAQDMPRDSVVDTPAGKMVQGPEALNQALAVIANQHERLKRLEGKNK
jgi:hypothetical protein